MSHPRKILIADPELESARGLTKALRTRGYQVHYAPDGSRALEVAVLRHPELVLFDEACTLIDARTFSQILRTNPRTEHVPVVLTTRSLDPDKSRGLRDGYFQKPFNVDEVLARIEHLFRRTEAAKELKGESKEIEGNLSQMSIADLLQILAMNRRSGRLNLVREGERGELYLAEGRPINAKVGIVEGEKALFRLLGWQQGSFSFFPGTPASRQRIQRAMDDALLEGMRQADEVARLSSSLPPRSARVHLAAGADLPGDQHPVTSQVVELLGQSRTVAELMDLAAATDLEVMLVLSTLMQKGVARIAENEDAGAVGPLLAPAEVHALRTRLFRSRSPYQTVVAKVFVVGAGSAAARKLLAGVPGLQHAASEPEAIRSGFGTLGRYSVAEGLSVDFCLLPHAEAARPLWRPFCGGAAGALVMDSSEGAMRLGTYLGWEVRVPLVVVGREVPDALQGAPAGSAAVGSDVLGALRAVLIQSINPALPM
jgi:CheY-like chemotaxis protein